MFYSRLQNLSWYPWFVVLLCLCIVMLSNGMTNAGLTVFDETLLKEFGWTTAQLKTRETINFVGAGVLVLFAGYLVDRFGYKPLLLTGMFLLAVGYGAYGLADGIAVLYSIHVLFAVVIVCAGNVVAVVTAATAMPERRGLAVGFAVAGTSVGGIVIPLLANQLNQSLGWREATRIEALLPAIMFVVIALMLVNKTPGKSDKGPEQVKGVPYGNALRTHQFTLVTIAGGCTFFAILAVYSHLFLFMRSLEFSSDQAAGALGFLSAIALVGKLSAGWISGLASPFWLLRINMLVMLVGLVLVIQLPGAVYVGLLLIGLGWGGLHTLYNYVLIALFGMKAAGKINATVAIVQSIGAGLGAWVTAWLFDQSGSYHYPFVVVAFVLSLAWLVTLLIRPLSERQLTALDSGNASS